MNGTRVTGSDFARRLLRNRLAAAGGAVILFFFLVSALPGLFASHEPNRIDIVNILRDMRPEKLTDKSILCGSPQHIVDTLKQVEAAGIAEVILYFNYGQKPHVLVKEQMERFMHEVAPHFTA